MNHFGRDGQTMQGGASLSDHTEVVIEMMAMENEDVEVEIPGMLATSNKPISRKIRVRKARKGTRCWHEIGYNYNVQTNTYEEQGVCKK